MFVFASSLLSLISPWDHSRAVHFPRSRTRCPRPVAPPPPPRRHSDPHATPKKYHHRPPTRRHSEIHPPSKLDLRQELLNANVESGTWLGEKFEEADEIQDKFEHDIPLQRSVSLDRGKDIFEYLQTLSDWSGSSVGSCWTIHESASQDCLEHYRSLEDIPASPIKGKSRRASYDFDTAFTKGIGWSVLRDSYKGLDSESASLIPQIKKLKWNFSITTFDSFKSTDEDDDEDSKNFDPTTRDLRRMSTESTESMLEMKETGESSTQIGLKTVSFSSSGDLKRSKSDLMKVRWGDVETNTFKPFYRTIQPNASHEGYDSDKETINDTSSLPSLIKHMKKIYKNSVENLKSEVGQKENTDFKRSFVRKALYRSISTESEKKIKGIESESNLRTRKVGVNKATAYQGAKRFETNLRKELLRQSVSFNNFEDMLMSGDKPNRPLRRYDAAYANGNLPNPQTNELLVPTILITEPSSESSVTTSENEDTVEDFPAVVRQCDCGICMEEEKYMTEKKPTMFKVLSSIFVKTKSGKRLSYWDENNNLNDSEMYTCFMHILKLMLGLWLRHLDHN